MFRFIAFTFSLALVVAVITMLGSNEGIFPIPSFFKEIVIFFVFSNVALYTIIKRTSAQSPADFIKIYLGATVLRILFFGAFIFLLIRMDRSGATPNAIFFLLNYFLFTTLEVAILFIEINSQKSGNRSQKDQ